MRRGFSCYYLFISVSLLIVCTVSSLAVFAADSGDDITFQIRMQKEKVNGSSVYWTEEQAVTWDPKKTAVIICDMWNQHWCQGATERVGEMVPQVNKLIGALRAKGTLIIHAPSDTMEFYKDWPQRKRAMEAPKAEAPSNVTQWCNLDSKDEGPLPIDDSDGGCNCTPQCPGGGPWKSQHTGIEIAAEDAVSDSGEECFNLMAQRGIENLFILGVHTNMCVLGRSFGIRSMVRAGKHVLLVRDLTDTMYNHRMPPFVQHHRGTELVVEHIEKYWCPTATSDDIIAALEGKSLEPTVK